MASFGARIRALLRWQYLLAFFLGALLFGIVWWFIPSPLVSARYVGGVLFQSSNPNNYKYIDPLLACEVGPQTQFDDLTSTKHRVSDVIDSAERQGIADQVSVYFRSLNDAHWFDINGGQTYAPASLLKVFVMMAYYKESRDRNDPALLAHQIVFQGSPNPTADDSPGADIPHLVSGQSYTIDAVIKQMIVYSDNDALNTLIKNFDPDTTTSLSEIFRDLQITSPLTDENSYAMNVDQYAMVFRVLYSSTYLSRRLSEEALGILAQAQYNQALAAGVPSGIPVAHKFGVTTVTEVNGGSERQLHDCGIVYAPGHPYLLCVMTQGKDFQGLQSVIKDISASVYQSVGAASTTK